MKKIAEYHGVNYSKRISKIIVLSIPFKHICTGIDGTCIIRKVLPYK